MQIVRAAADIWRINSKEEFEYILKEIDKKGYNKIQFFLGGKRTIDSKEYYWLDENGRPYGNKINDPSYWCQNEWLKNEPSFQDGSIQECCLNMFYYSKGGRWVWNDAPNDILSVVPSFSGKIGYVCEYE